MFSLNLGARRDKFYADFKENRRKYISLGLLCIFLFLTIIYLGPFGGFERLGLIGKKKTEQLSKAAAIRGTSGDLWADLIIGQPDFSEVSSWPVLPNYILNAHSAIVDRVSSPNKLYIYDTGHNRILGFDANKCLTSTTNPLTCSADIVIGQPSLYTSACNHDSAFQNYPIRAPASANSLCSFFEAQLSIGEVNKGSSMAIDSQGNLYVADFYNHRVLKYNKPFETDVIADDVWGQNDFSGNLCNKGRGMGSLDASSFCFDDADQAFMAGADIDLAGNLWVTEAANRRILRFPKDATSGQIAKTADLVIGQKDFTSKNYTPSLSILNGPAAARISPYTGKLYVADRSFNANRVLVFTPPLTNGMSGELFGSDFNYPAGVDFDPSQPNAVWIADAFHRVVELWDENTKTKIKELGIRDFANTLDGPTGSLGIDSSGNIFVPQGRDGVSMALFRKGGSNTTPQYMFAPLTGYPNSNPQLYTASKIDRAASGVAIADNQMLVSTFGRIMFWNNPDSLSNYKPADGVAGDAGRITNFSQSFPGCCHFLKADKVHHLWMSVAYDSQGSRYISVYQLPLTNGAKPIKNIYFPLPLLGGGQVNLSSITFTLAGIAPTPNGDFLWVTDSDNHRVFRVRDPLTNPVVDVVLGQKDATQKACNRGGANVSGALPDSLCFPGVLSIDRLGNLYVGDSSGEVRGNMRLLVFRSDLFPTNNTSVIYAPAASKIFPNHATFEAAFDSQNRMVVGFNPVWGNDPSPDGKSPGRFPAIYNDPLGTSTTPDAFIKDFHSFTHGVAFDDNNNLYIADLNRARVLIYKNPLNNLMPTPTPSPTPIITPSPVSSPSSSPVPTPSPLIGDTQAPSAAIAEPLNGSNVSGNVKISAVASDNVNVVKMEIYVDNNLVASASLANSIYYTWNTNPKKVSSGSHSIVAKAYDAVGNVGSATATVNKSK